MALTVLNSLRIESMTLVVVDLINDSLAEDGYFNRELHFDIKRMRTIVPYVVKVIRYCKKLGIPVIYVTSVYDLEYLFSGMYKRFLKMGVSGLALKGSRGIQFIEDLPQPPDYIVVKSHYSAFSSRSLLFKPKTGSYIEDYLKLPSSKDKEIKRKGLYTLLQLYEKAHHERFQTTETKVFFEYLNKGGVSTLELFLNITAKNIVIVIGVSTHVCVYSTVIGASERGFEVVIIDQAISSEDEKLHSIFLSNMAQFNAQLVHINQLKSLLNNN